MMSAVLVDSNILIDIMSEDAAWFDWSADALAMAADHGRVLINPIIYAEVSVRYSRIEDLDEALPSGLIEREALPYAAAFLAGKCFETYRLRGGQRTSPLPDFFIGGHAAVAGYRLLTRDPARYLSYLPGLELITPQQGSSGH